MRGGCKVRAMAESAGEKPDALLCRLLREGGVKYAASELGYKHPYTIGASSIRHVMKRYEIVEVIYHKADGETVRKYFTSGEAIGGTP